MLSAILRCLLYLPFAYALRLATFVFAPVVVLLVDKDGRAPWLFRWIETHDDLGWHGPTTVEPTRRITEKYGRRVGLMFWWWRNQAYTAQYKLFSIPFLTEKVDVQEVKHWGTLESKVRGFTCLFVKAKIDGKTYFELQPRYGFEKLVVYIRIGWKLDLVAKGAEPRGSMGMYTGFTPRSNGM